jgi:predicted Zn-dependent protease
LRIELRRFIGNAEFDNSAISRAITQAKNYQRYDREFLECDSLHSLIIEKAYALLATHPNKKKITIPDLKISQPALSSTSSASLLEISVDKILFFNSGTCPTKFFRPKY